jgi:hypothetical protein
MGLARLRAKARATARKLQYWEQGERKIRIARVIARARARVRARAKSRK